MKSQILSNGKEAYLFEDIAFCNTELFRETAKNFIKNGGVYTKAPKNSTEYKEFWDLEEYRLNHGMTIPGKLITNSKGEVKIQNVSISGEHYGYLNYGRIKLTQDLDYSKDPEKILKNRGRVKVTTFPDFWDGDYHFFKAKELAKKLGLNIVVMKARRKGYSYKNGYLAAHTAQFIRRSISIIGAYEYRYISGGNATMDMAKNYIDWFENNTDFARHYLKGGESINPLEIELGFIPTGESTPIGYRSQILGLSFKDNPDAAVGKDGTLIIFEETGKFPNLKQSLDVTLPTLEDGDYKTGQMIMFGTGGSKDSNWTDFEHIFYNPLDYDCLPFINVWDDNSTESSCGFFHSHILNYTPYIDESGNSLLAEADKRSEDLRVIKKANSKPITYNNYVAQRCKKPSEAFSNGEANFFVSPELTEHYNYVKNTETVNKFGREGKFVRIGEISKFFMNEELTERERFNRILSYNFKKEDDVEGCYVEFYPFYRNSKGLIPENLYRVWNDPYAFDKEKNLIRFGDSLGATYVYERSNTFTKTKGDIIVGMYIGRPSSLDTYNEHLLAITLACNGKLQFENDRGDVKHFFRKEGFYSLLADSPDFNWKPEFSNKTGTTRSKGISMSSIDKKGSAALLLREWLYTKRGFDESTNKIIYNFHTISDIATLEELLKWSLKGNFDRISALLVGMFDKQECFNKDIESILELDDEFDNENNIFNRSLY